MSKFTFEAATAITHDLSKLKIHVEMQTEEDDRDASERIYDYLRAKHTQPMRVYRKLMAVRSAFAKYGHGVRLNCLMDAAHAVRPSCQSYEETFTSGVNLTKAFLALSECDPSLGVYDGNIVSFAKVDLTKERTLTIALRFKSEETTVDGMKKVAQILANGYAGAFQGLLGYSVSYTAVWGNGLDFVTTVDSFKQEHEDA